MKIILYPVAGGQAINTSYVAFLTYVDILRNGKNYLYIAFTI